MITLLVILLLCVAGVIMTRKVRAAGSGFVRSGGVFGLRRQPPLVSHRPAVQRKAFNAVSIACGPASCQAAKRLAGKRGFPQQIPRLPLSQCDADTCHCTFVHHADRREAGDRRASFGRLALNTLDADRREALDRRHNSIAPEQADDLDAFNIRR